MSLILVLKGTRLPRFLHHVDLCSALNYAILVHVSRVNLEEHGAKVGTVRCSPVNLVAQDSTKVCTVQFQVYFSLQ